MSLRRGGPWKWSLPGMVVAALAAAFFNPPSQDVTSGALEFVQRIVGGDTRLLGTGERVRLIGVDTPETKRPNTPVLHFGKEATAFTRRMVEGKRVTLKFDPANEHLKHRDRYGRTLAFVFLEDGIFLNAEIIERGYGFAYTQFPFRYLEAFRRL